ncbi:MAG: DUF3568 family protein [Candidatus Omnitrophica bacterium]|nr:DUF3568 family protein [Candidatus Omnitrophota bacterium]
MKRKIGIAFLAGILFVNLSGCAPLLVGVALGGATVYAISKDTIQGDTEKQYDSLWDASINVAGTYGMVKTENRDSGYLFVEGPSGRVWIHLVRLTRTATRIKISARNKFHLPDLNKAQEVFVKLMEQAG